LGTTKGNSGDLRLIRAVKSMTKSEEPLIKKENISNGTTMTNIGKAIRLLLRHDRLSASVKDARTVLIAIEFEFELKV
jgi:hypothetical protein